MLPVPVKVLGHNLSAASVASANDNYYLLLLCDLWINIISNKRQYCEAPGGTDRSGSWLNQIKFKPVVFIVKDYLNINS